MKSDHKPIIQKAENQAQREAIYRLRYQIHVDELGKHPADADHQRGQVRDSLDESADLFYAEVNSEIIASLRINRIDASAPIPTHWYEVYHLNEFNQHPDSAKSLSSRLVVAAQWRSSPVLGLLLLQAYEFVRQTGIRFDFCNCVPSLVGFYEQLGYRRYQNGFLEEDTGYHIPLVLITEDAEHLKAVRSPFHRIARNCQGNRSDDSDWFKQHFPEHAQFVNRRLLSSEEYWRVLNEKMARPVTESIPLFAELEASEIQQFIATGSLLKVRAGDTLIRPGDVGNEMFVVLSGVAEVYGHSGQTRQSLAVLGEGQVFGEIAFLAQTPRSAEVIANTDMELLILTQPIFRKAMARLPAITAKVLLNLSLVLCERLRDSTQAWMEGLKNDE